MRGGGVQEEEEEGRRGNLRRKKVELNLNDAHFHLIIDASNNLGGVDFDACARNSMQDYHWRAFKVFIHFVHGASGAKHP